MSIAYFGKFSDVHYTNKEEVIVVEKLPEGQISILDRKDRLSTIWLVVGFPSAVLLLMLFGLSFGMSIYLVVIGLIIFFGLDAFVSFLFKKRPKI